MSFEKAAQLLKQSANCVNAEVESMEVTQKECQCILT
jgi:hypothetical protein